MSIKYCSIDGCYMDFYARGMCRKHYRQQCGLNGGYKKDYDRRKNDPKYKEMRQKSDKQYREKLNDAGIMAGRQHKYYKTWRDRLINEGRKEVYDARQRDIKFFDGMRQMVLERDNYRCVICGITNEDHQKKYGDQINIHHIDGKGCLVPRDEKNNELDNLKTLCKSCHSKQHFITKLTEKQVLEIREKYKTGKYLQKDLAKEYGISQSNVSYIITKEVLTDI